MKAWSPGWSAVLLRIGLSAVPAAFLEGLRLASGSSFSWPGLVARWLFFAVVLLTSLWTLPIPTTGTNCSLPWPGILAAGIGLGAVLVYVLRGATWGAWIVLGALYLLLLGLDRVFTYERRSVVRWGIRSMLALAGGLFAVALAQTESHFADEEFFVALQGLSLGLFGFLLLTVNAWATQRQPLPADRGLQLGCRWLGPALILLALAGLGATVRVYQRSFYPLQAPLYEGISAGSPFLCGEAPPERQTYDGRQLFGRLLARVEAHPDKGAPEYGMLALGTGEQQWAQAFRENLLREAREEHFTGPANSVKWMQYEAAQRAYYLPRVQAAFPGLFSDDDLASLQGWFAGINRRALTVEWVDWLYGLALSKLPEGPYENQENGAGLLALLESEDLAAVDSSPANREYLDRDRRGWDARFRNTDDAYIYQPEWINNALFQFLYTGETAEDNMQHAFEWLLLQAPPDGTPLRYNHPGNPPLAASLYLGAMLLQDPRYIWLAGRALADLEAKGKHLPAQPGAEQPTPLTGISPTQGSCLLYGDSGLPNQIGPLAADKIVFRDGWSEDSAYLLLNLRFSGWHRYKATNTLSLLYQNGPLAADNLQGEPFRWLPIGRSLFRDKRIPRENLNGLLIERSGMSAVLYTLTSIGGPWAQDPPYYAEVMAFETGEEQDWSHTRLADWRGWQHDRWIFFYHQAGPIIVIDDAHGPARGQAALAWHLVGQPALQDQRIQLRGGDQPAEMMLLPLVADEVQAELDGEQGSGSASVLYHSATGGRIRAATLFLLGTWAGAQVEYDAEEQTLRIAQGQDHITLPLPVDN